MEWSAFLAAPLTLAAAASPAFALTDPLDAVEPTAVVDDLLDEVTGATEPVDDVLDAVTETAKPVTDVVEDTTEPVTDVVEDTTGRISDLLEDGGNDPITEPVEDVTDTVRDVVDDPVEQITGPRGDPSPTDPTDQGHGPGADDGDRSGGGGPAGGHASPDDVRLRFPPPAGSVDARAAGPSARAASRPEAGRRASAVPGQSAWQRVGRGARDAAEAFSFPMVLAAAVGLFLLVQGRIDARDPKLAAGPDDDQLVFM